MLNTLALSVSTTDDQSDLEVEIVYELDTEDMLEPYDLFWVPADSAIIAPAPTVQDEINLDGETALICEWVDATIAGDPEASLYEHWLAQHASARLNRPLTIAA